MRDRTADLLRARQALSQLSYNPIVIANLVTGILSETGRFTTQFQEEFGRPEWT